jgi:Domain of unknown function (DUF4417)
MIGGCGRCSFLRVCGGLDGVEPDFFGCHLAPEETCRKNGWTCPICNTVEYVRRTGEVHARATGGGPVLAPSCELPPYVARIDHAKHWSGVLRVDAVALPTKRVVGGHGRNFGPKFASRRALLRSYHLPSHAHVLLISVSSDPYLEQYWGWAKRTATPERLAALGIAGITIPNFSFFSDAHRYHLLYNRGRIEACLAELSTAGVPVIPHIHALTTGDHRYWIGWLRVNPQVRYVCREFQTGNGETEIDELARIQDVAGRELHPLVIGGARFAPRLRELFARSTIVDATPFVKAQNGQRAILANGRVQWVSRYTASPPGRGQLLQHNINVYEALIAKRYTPDPQLSMLDAFDQTLRARQAVRDRTARAPSQFDQQALALAQPIGEQVSGAVIEAAGYSRP